MKRIKMVLSIFAGFLSQASVSHAGAFIIENMYSNHSLVQGFGKSFDEAQADAKSAFPKATAQGKWVQDSKNSPATSCAESGVEKKKFVCQKAGDLMVVTIPVVFKKVR